jgi:uncharacterized RDD family membrane protein YckC
MPTETEFWEAASQVVSERGALVVGFKKDSDQPELGSTLNNVLGFKARTEVSVTGFSDWQDWQEQVEVFYRLRPAWGRGKSGDPGAMYYRVKFDPAAKSTAGLASSFSSGLVLPSLGQYMESGLRGVSFWPRALARVIDIVIHRLLIIVAAFIFGILLRIATSGRPPVWISRGQLHTSLEMFLSGAAGWFAYHVICTSVSGSTLGKLLLSMQVVQDDGSPCRLKSAILRELGYYVPDGLFFGILGYISMKHDPMHKRHGDDWAGTMVCKRAYLPARSQQDAAMKFLLGFMLGAFADIALVTLGALVQMNF